MMNMKAQPFRRKTSTTTTPTAVEVTFGNVTVRVMPPDARTIKANVEAGQKALKRAQSVLTKPGITLDKPRGIPFYYGDPDNPDLLIREIDGELVRGRMSLAGKFIPLTTST